ncbi:MAG: hypothetical protein OXT64_01700, partial [Gammaproteobacteria bacterium]|nr:hypothetical protein [Gammaproteobacteria bacterium]
SRAELMQFFRIVDGQADHMRGIISDLLDVGRIETGTLSVDPQPTALAPVIEQARTTFLNANLRNPVYIDLLPELPHVMVDRQRMVQVLNNLLTNAARHSPESAPIRIATVSISPCRSPMRAPVLLRSCCPRCSSSMQAFFTVPANAQPAWV